MSRRLANALALQSILGAQAAIVPHQVIFSDGIFSDGTHMLQHGGIFWFGSMPKRKRNQVKTLLVGNWFGGTFDGTNSKSHVDLAWAKLHEILIRAESRLPPKKKNLTIHLRGGDVFGPRKPESYGQPPLSFYEFVLKFAEWKSVTIVHEDELNPVLPGVLELCKSLRLSFRAQSGTVIEDICLLTQTYHLVASRGTFSPAIANISRYCKEVFYFEDKFNLIPERSGLRAIRVFDRHKIYARTILADNWANSHEQRNLMLTYPLSSLAVER